MRKFNTFKEWFDSNGTVDELNFINRVDLLKEIKSLHDVRSMFILSQNYEMAARVRSVEKTILVYLEVDQNFNIFTTKNGVFKSIDTLIMYESRVVNIDILTKDVPKEES